LFQGDRHIDQGGIWPAANHGHRSHRGLGEVSALFILKDFLGWEKGPGWEEMVFAPEHERNIDKMAIVGPEQWRDLVCAFAGKGFRSVAIEYFLPSQLETAKKWLTKDTPRAQ
jgi:hypothetical protein